MGLKDRHIIRIISLLPESCLEYQIGASERRDSHRRWILLFIKSDRVFEFNYAESPKHRNTHRYGNNH